jgi:predicted RNA binding protein YcfA (HicA-like mRNA interferase family)
MPRLPRVSGQQARQAFERAGWVHRRTAGDHMQLTMPGKRTLAVPDYRVLPTFILRGLLRTADLTVEEFLDLLD